MSLKELFCLIEAIHQDPNLSPENQSKLETAKQNLLQADDFGRMTEEAKSQLKQLDNGLNNPSTEIEKLRLQLDVARQRHGTLTDRIKSLTPQIQKNLSNRAILKDFGVDDTNLPQFLFVFAQGCLGDAEMGMYRAELELHEAILDRLPLVISRFDHVSADMPKESGNQSPTPTRTPLTNRKQSDTPSDLPMTLAVLSEQKVQLTRELERIERQSRAVEERNQSLQEKFSEIGLAEGNQVVLLETHRTLPSETEYRIQNFGTQLELRQTNLELLKAEKLRDELRARFEGDPGIEGDSAMVKVEAGNLALQTDLDVADRLVSEYQALHSLNIQISSERVKLITHIKNLRQFLDQKLLWVQNADPISWNDVTNGTEGMSQLLATQSWTGLFQGLLSKNMRRPLDLLILTAGLFFLRWTSLKLMGRSLPRRAGV